MDKKYDPSVIEPKWQKVWEKSDIYQAKDFSKKKKFYLLVEFPYCSGVGLHIGHARAWLPTDALARKKRMDGYNVLFPMGWDAFGLPTENYAIKTGRPPAEITAENIAHFRAQAKSLGLSFDWSREVDTSDPYYYKWTQWIFVQMFKKGLAYQAEVPVNWCPTCKTNLADEEVLGNGTHERCGKPTEKRLQKQWLLRITKYADRLIEDLKKVDYPNQVATQQINWIGRKEGLTIHHKVKDMDLVLDAFTAFPAWIWADTYFVISPEHPVIAELVKRTENEKKVLDFVGNFKKNHAGKAKTKLDEKEGIFTGRYVIDPITGREFPVWLANFALMEFGTGMIRCSCHDPRDFEFASKYKIPLAEVVAGGLIGKINAHENQGILINSGPFDGRSVVEVIPDVCNWVAKKKIGEKMVTYHLHDWIFSRQHYWGEPIPIIHCPKCGPVVVPEEELPIKLPFLEKYEPTGTGESPLAQATEWLKAKCPNCGREGRRETDTMPNWAGSNWYFIRYIDPYNDHELADKKLKDYWLPVDIYEGGFEHTTLHLLYSRFIYKFLFDIGVVSTDEPYTTRRVHGILLASDNRKMSKSLGNVIDPIEVVTKYGSDTLRLYEMFIGPFDQQVVWNDRSLAGCYRFLGRIWNLSQKVTAKTDPEVVTRLNHTINKVSQDLEAMKFNTAVAALMEFVNAWEKAKGISKEHLDIFLCLLVPFAPHLSEEIWSYQHNDSVHAQKWPEIKKIEDNMVKMIPVSVNGKVRGKVLDGPQAVALAQKTVAGQIKRTIYVPGRIINFVTN